MRISRCIRINIRDSWTRYVCFSWSFWRIHLKTSNANRRKKNYFLFSECSSTNWRKSLSSSYRCTRLYLLIKTCTKSSFDNWISCFHETTRWLERTFEKEDRCHREKWRTSIINTFRFVEHTRYDYAVSRFEWSTDENLSNKYEFFRLIKINLTR